MITVLAMVEELFHIYALYLIGHLIGAERYHFYRAVNAILKYSICTKPICKGSFTICYTCVIIK